jgi:hypothetical protein
MANDSKVFLPSDAFAMPSFGVAGVDMTGVGWSLRVACQIEVGDRPNAYCRLAVGHGGAHQTQPVDRQARPADDQRRPIPRTTDFDEPAGACAPSSGGHPAPSPGTGLVRQGPRRSRGPGGPVRPRDGHR